MLISGSFLVGGSFVLLGLVVSPPIKQTSRKLATPTSVWQKKNEQNVQC